MSHALSADSGEYDVLTYCTFGHLLKAKKP